MKVKMVIALLFLFLFLALAFFADSVEAQQKQNVNDESNIPQARSGQTTLYQTTTTTNTPGLMSYLGILADANGKPFFAPTNVTFSIYASATGGSPLWSETHAITPSLTGVFGVALGSGNPISPVLFKENSTLYVAVKVANDVEMSPRQRITSAAFAFSADTATPREGYGNPVGIGMANVPGAAITLARSDHVHQGVRSLAKSGSNALYGDVTLSAGINTILTQTGQNLEVSVPSTAFARIGRAGSPTLTGDVVLEAGKNMALEQSGQTIKIIGIDDPTFNKITLIPTAATTVPITVTGIADSTASIIDLNVRSASAIGGIIAVDYAAATTLTGSVEGVHLDLGANVTGNRNVTGVNVTLPSDDVSATRVGYKVTSAATASGTEIGVDIAGSSDIGVQIGGAAIDITTIGNEELTIESAGSGTITIGNDASAESINLGTGAGAKTLLIGSTNSTSSTTIQSGSGNITLAPSDTGDVVATLDRDTNANFNGAISSDVSINLVEVNITATAGLDTGNLVGLAVRNLNETVTGTVTGTGTPDSLIAAISLDANETVGNGLLIEQNATGGSIDDGLKILATAGTINDGIQIGLGTQTITNAINIASTGVATDIILQNGDSIDNDINSQFRFKINEAGIVTILAADTDATTPLTISSAGAGLLTLTPTGAGSVAIGSANVTGVTLTVTATSLVNVLTGNLKVGSGAPNFSLDGEDAYVTGTLEVDGAVRFDGAVNILAGSLTDSSVITADLAASSVTEAKLAAGSVTNTKLGTGSVTMDKIEDLNVTEAKLAAGSVTNTKLGTGSVTEAKIADGNVTEAKIADANVTKAKLSTDATNGVFGYLSIYLREDGSGKRDLTLLPVAGDIVLVEFTNTSGSVYTAAAKLYTGTETDATINTLIASSSATLGDEATEPLNVLSNNTNLAALSWITFKSGTSNSGLDHHVRVTLKYKINQ